MRSEEERINNFFRENNFYHDAYETYNGTIEIEIIWGDWKHDHWRCDYLMDELGYELDNVEETEEDGSDAYSAIRTYVKKGEKK